MRERGQSVAHISLHNTTLLELSLITDTLMILPWIDKWKCSREGSVSPVELRVLHNNVFAWLIHHLLSLLVPPLSKEDSSSDRSIRSSVSIATYCSAVPDSEEQVGIADYVSAMSCSTMWR